MPTTEFISYPRSKSSTSGRSRDDDASPLVSNDGASRDAGLAGFEAYDAAKDVACLVDVPCREN